MSDSKMIEILLVEDNPGDVRLAVEAMKNSDIVKHISVVRDGVQAMEFLRHQGPYVDTPRPDLMLLDLNLPRMDGREVLADMKQDPALQTIPVVVLTTSDAEQDIVNSYALHANCFINKPVDFDNFMRVIRAIEGFWLNIVKLPH